MVTAAGRKRGTWLVVVVEDKMGGIIPPHFSPSPLSQICGVRGGLYLWHYRYGREWSAASVHLW